MHKAWQIISFNATVPYVIRQMVSWLSLKQMYTFRKVHQYLVILMTVFNHNLPLSDEGKTTQEPDTYIVM